MKVLLDMNLPPKLAELLTKNGIESVHWFYIGAPDAKDKEIITYSCDNDYILMSCDLDFSTIHSVTHDLKPSVVQIRIQDIQIEQFVELITLALQQNEIELTKGAIMTIDAQKARVRLLPL